MSRSVLREAFLDELEKIAAAHGRLRMPKSRSGRRPLSVDTLLRKEKDGTLYKDAGVVSFVDPSDPNAARPPKKKGDVPTREEDQAAVKREDGRGNAATVTGTSTNLENIGVTSTATGERDY